MIQKNLFFIWFGSKPKYVDFCVSNFHKINLDFNIKTYFYTDEDVLLSKQFKGPIYDLVGKKIIEDSIYNTETNDDFLKTYHNKDIIYKISLSDRLRYLLIYRYGGIYLDCDTFPIKPFDDELLSLENFCVTQGEDKGDIFFIGRNKDTNFKDCVKLSTNSHYDKLWNNKKFINMCTKFNNCELVYGDYFNDPKEHYIDHYWIRENKY